jgi:hypothetical protein
MEEELNINEGQKDEKSESSKEVNENVTREQSIESTQLQTENSKLQTEEMEVHHHPKVEKKNFKEYFLEFLMIFLAVTLGFFAENIRESFTEHHQEKEYILSFYEDLKTDTARIAAIINKDEVKLTGLSNLADCYDTVYNHPQSETGNWW